MYDDNFLTMKQIRLLEDNEKGLTNEEISEKYGIDLTDVDGAINEALRKREILRGLSKSAIMPVKLREVNGRIGVEQTGTIRVGSQIIRYLSEGIYSSPAGSIKEIINNAYDADASEVKVSISENGVVIEDNGQGMDWKTFDEDFTFIGVSIKRKDALKTKVYKRPVIGFLGIGFISVSELCDTLIISSGIKDSDSYFVAEIDFSRYRENFE